VAVKKGGQVVAGSPEYLECETELFSPKTSRGRSLLELRQKIIAARHGAHNLRVFGSVARGEASPESDLDLSMISVTAEEALSS
jgi:hypothetical protein